MLPNVLSTTSQYPGESIQMYPFSGVGQFVPYSRHFEGITSVANIDYLSSVNTAAGWWPIQTRALNSSLFGSISIAEHIHRLRSLHRLKADKALETGPRLFGHRDPV